MKSNENIIFYITPEMADMISEIARKKREALQDYQICAILNSLIYNAYFGIE